MTFTLIQTVGLIILLALALILTYIAGDLKGYRDGWSDGQQAGQEIGLILADAKLATEAVQTLGEDNG